ncbi:MAG: RNA polymerase subunit sigma-70 [Acidobacteria bacterium]|nr:MAG: RNA polymerase subunit sigma-70 [Acidobacteriota bacterium]
MPAPEADGVVTDLLRSWGGGDSDALRRLVPLVYADLRQIAARHMRRERHGHTLDVTGLVHEAFLRLAGQRAGAWENRHQFFSVAARLMRRVLVDHARRRQAIKRGAAPTVLSLEEMGGLPEPAVVDLTALDDAMKDLAAFDLRKSQIVELRFFGGLSVEETAEELALSPATVKREWAVARAWLHRAVNARGALRAPGPPR